MYIYLNLIQRNFQRGHFECFVLCVAYILSKHKRGTKCLYILMKTNTLGVIIT